MPPHMPSVSTGNNHASSNSFHIEIEASKYVKYVDVCDALAANKPHISKVYMICLPLFLPAMCAAIVKACALSAKGMCGHVHACIWASTAQTHEGMCVWSYGACAGMCGRISPKPPKWQM